MKTACGFLHLSQIGTAALFILIVFLKYVFMMHFILCISLNDYDSLAVLLSFHLHLVPKCKVAWWWWGSASDPCSTTSAALPKNECVQAAAVFVIRSLQSSQADRENTAASLHSRALKWFQEALVSTHFPPAPLVYFLKLVTLKKEKKKKRVRKKKNQVTRSQPIMSHPSWTGSAPARFCHQ